MPSLAATLKHHTKLKKIMLHYKETEYGFEYGAAKIERTCSDTKKGWVILSLETQKDCVRMYITKTGKIRIYTKKGEWRPPQ